MKNLKVLLTVIVGLTLMSCNKEITKTYSATISQSFENSPIAYVFENDLGELTYSYISEGVYHITRDGGFPIENTFILCNNGVDGLISADLRHWTDEFIEIRTFAGVRNDGTPQPHNGCAGISFEIKVREQKR